MEFRIEELTEDNENDWEVFNRQSSDEAFFIH
jgi:hypothetical protein